MNYPKTILSLIDIYKKLPGVGSKSAERFALFTVSNFNIEDRENFKEILSDLSEKLKTCSICGIYTESDICSICSDENRDLSKLIIVESFKDVLTFENIDEYSYKYHILGGCIDLMNGVTPDDLNLKSLIVRLQDENIKELIIATSSTQEGDITAKYISQLLKAVNITISRIGVGVPLGSELEYTDVSTLQMAIKNRTVMK